MINEPDDVQRLIESLQSLQLQQSDLLVRLQAARNREARAGRETAQTAGTEEPRRHTVQPDRVERRAPGEFVIRDRVRIINPGFLQPNEGIVVKITDTRVTVQTESGRKIVRAHKNLRLLL